MEAVVPQILRNLATPPILTLPDWDAVADNSRPFRIPRDARRDGFGATLDQKQPDSSVRPTPSSDPGF